MKKVVVGAVVVALISGMVMFWKGAENDPTRLPLKGEAQKPVLKIGVIAPLTGNNSHVGVNCRNGVDFAVSRLSSSPFAYEIVSEDSQFSPARAATIAHKMISADGVDAIITCEAPSGNAVAPIADKAGKLMIAIIASAQEIAVGHPNVFLHWPLINDEGRVLAGRMRRDGVRKAAIFEEAQPGAMGLSLGLQQELKKAGVVYEVFGIMPGERNFGDIAAKARAENPDAYVFLSLPPALNMLVKKLNESDTSTKRYSIEFPTWVDEKEIAEGMVFADAYDGAPESIGAYRARYNSDNVYGAAFAMDAMMMIDRVVSDCCRRNGRVPTGAEMAAGMRGLKGWSGAVGPVAMDSEGRIASRVVLKVMKNGRAEIAEE